MKVVSYIIPILLFALIIFALIKKINVFDCFLFGAKSALKLVYELFPSFLVVLMMTHLAKESGLFDAITDLLTPVLSFLGLDKSLVALIILKPISGSASLAVLNDIFATYGADSFVARCASVIFGSGETVFYISTIYFSKCKKPKLFLPIAISLFSTFFGAVFACFICRFL